MVVDANDGAGDLEVGSGYIYDFCNRLIGENLGFPHWLQAIVLCEMAEERENSGDHDGAVRLANRAEQIAIEFSDDGPGARAVSKLKHDLGIDSNDD